MAATGFSDRGAGTDEPAGGSRMLRRWAGAASLAATAGLLLSGCAVADRAGPVIPCGQWAGQGSFVYEDWESKDDQAGEKERSIHREYQTRLTIRPATLDGHEVLEMEIVSDRGSLPEAGDQTHIRAALVEGKRVSETMVLYRLVGFAYNPQPDERLEYKADTPAYAASCLASDDETIIQVKYHEGFVDTFRFRGRRLTKTGVFHGDGGGLIHWSERLVRQP